MSKSTTESLINSNLATEALKELIRRFESGNVSIEVLEHKVWDYNKEIDNWLTVKWKENK